MAITVTDYQPDDTVAIDTYIDSGSPTANAENADAIRVGGTGGANKCRAILGFNWIWESYLNRKIKFTSDLKVSLYVNSIGATYPTTPPAYYFIKRDIVESQVTWNIWKTGNSWQTAGATGANDIYTPELGYSGANWAAGSWYNVLVPVGFLEQCKAGTYYGILLIGREGDTPGWWSIISSSSNATAAQRPKYSFSYEPYHKIFPISAGLGQVR